jgi:excisionase family DNA binding protein
MKEGINYMEKENIKMMREVEEVAALTGSSNDYIRGQCRSQKIKAIKFGKRWVIPQAEVDRILMINPTDSAAKTELSISKLQAENRALQMQLETIRTLLYSATKLIG